MFLHTILIIKSVSYISEIQVKLHSSNKLVCKFNQLNKIWSLVYEWTSERRLFFATLARRQAEHSFNNHKLLCSWSIVKDDPMSTRDMMILVVCERWTAEQWALNMTRASSSYIVSAAVAAILYCFHVGIPWQGYVNAYMSEHIVCGFCINVFREFHLVSTIHRTRPSATI